MIPQTILNRGGLNILWRRCKTNRDLNYPTPDADHWLPKGTVGWAAHTYVWSFLPDESVEPYLCYGMSRADLDDIGDEYITVPYQLPGYLFDQPAEEEKG